MKYFTKEWRLGQLADDIVEETVAKYEAHIESIFRHLPVTLKILAKNIDLEDGIIRKISYFSEKHSLRIEGIFGDLRVGYFNLELLYLNVSKLEQDALSSVFKDQKLEVLSSEIDLTPPRIYSHRMLFSTDKEIEITFTDIAIAISAADAEDYKEEACELIVE